MKKYGVWILCALLGLGIVDHIVKPVSGQGNPTCPTRPPGDNSNACASTSFVQTAIIGVGAFFRLQLQADTDYYVNGNSGSTAACGPTGALTCSAGSNSNDCLTPGTACLTVQHVADIIIGTRDLAQHLARVNLAHNAGTTNYNVLCTQGPIIGNAGFTIIGDSSAPTTVNITAPNGGNGITTRDYCIISLQHVKILDQGTAVSGVDITQNSIMDLVDVHFGAFNTNANMITIEGGNAKTTLLSGIAIEGNAGTFLACLGSNTVDFNSSAVTIANPVNFSTSTVFASGPCNLRGLGAGSFTGGGVAGTTGTRAILANGAMMQAGGTTCNSVWPGNVPCSITNLAYDDAADLTTGNIAITITAGTTSTSGITSGNFMSSTTNKVVDSGKAVPAGAVVGTTDSQVLTTKTISGASNTLTNIGNSSLTNSATTVAGATCTLGSTCGLSTASNTLGADVALNNIANYFDGPSMAQGTTGTWWASGSVTVKGNSNDIIRCKLWDGTTVKSSTQFQVTGSAPEMGISLNGIFTSPAGNIRISCRNVTSTTATAIVSNDSANSADSTVWGIRIN